MTCKLFTYVGCTLCKKFRVKDFLYIAEMQTNYSLKISKNVDKLFMKGGKVMLARMV